MQNFNTNQTRQFYVAAAIDSSVDTNLDIALGTAATGEMYFKYKNADGIVTRSDTFDPKKVTSLKKTLSASMAKPLLKHTIVVNTAEFADAAALAGKTVKLKITVHQVFDYDDSNSTTFTVRYKVPTSITNANFYLALKGLVETAMPKPDKSYPYFTVTSSASGLVLTEAVQKYVRGKLSGEPVHLSVAFGIDAATFGEDEMVAWGTDTVAESGSVVPANYALADLEYFALGERGDVFRGNNWPNNYDVTYVIDPNGATAYDVLTVEYYWAGDAENVQKSPRMIQIAAPHNDTSADDICTTLYNAIVAAM